MLVLDLYPVLQFNDGHDCKYLVGTLTEILETIICYGIFCVRLRDAIVSNEIKSVFSSISVSGCSWFTYW